MILLPAIDILGGKAVRLAQGEFARQTVYDTDPLQAARRWAAAGARGLHVVDLDGARLGRPANLDQVERIARELKIPLQVGGGLRTIDAVQAALDAGAARVVLGTAAHRDRDLLEEVVALLGERLVVSVDARGGRPAAAGWTEEVEIPATEMIRRLCDCGVRRFVCSSIDRDGTLAGPDLEMARQVAETVRGSFLYSGGISSLEDLRALRALGAPNLAGVIVGKALYERRFTVAQAQRMLDQPQPPVVGGRVS